ncbi:uncharacterized protein Z519_07264 [Cladophialophora bantiana CBS 173.52]|uniref:Short-chain dehydrogenase/reductase family protein n=1 Tax=Cladophialophora bantiana (strain ATCC 10958 / CBS 173.52 / CDC B-1940 / NIH 8579) TaxID=1442370 RepID=A0A0D2HN65_CLAB1|nr:uncharacterized protein Z519_07264 [Cladophialophora bantiana CBS 173.52]KIW92280.1 hypothetical protein Z519_07264 [Cladophialophora bantiana CBS 173.52]
MPSSKDLPPITTPFFPRLFIRNQFLAKPQRPPKSTDLSGKVVIITGGNTGLGFECARQLLSFNLTHLILAVRSPQKGKDAAKKLHITYPKATIDVWELDMASYDSIQAFVQRAETELSRLDIAILNSGRWAYKYRTIPSTGHEELFQINYLSTVLLCILLLPVLRSKAPAGTPGRVTIINAALSLVAKFQNRNKTPLLPSFDDPKAYDMSESYNTSKVLAHMFLWKLEDYVSADDVVVNLADPGFVKGTQLARDAPSVMVFLGNIFAALTARSIRDGASTYLDACLLKGKESHGCFIMGWQIKPFATMLYTPEGKDVIEKLWRETMDELSFANVQLVLESMRRR